MIASQFILELLKVLLSTPVIAGIAFFWFLAWFRQDIKELLRRVATISFPGGGAELATPQMEAAKKEQALPAAPREKVTIPPSLTPTDPQKVNDLLKAERARAGLWEYRFLNYFLVRHTQMVLDWLAALSSRTTVEFYDTAWLPLIPNAEERQAVLTALQAHHLIAIQNNLLEVTAKGREYIQWRGPLPEKKT